MMKIRILMFLYISVWLLPAEEPKFILAYQVDERDKLEEQLSYRRHSDPEEVGEQAVAKRLKVPPFRSRFFEEGDELWDLTDLALPRLKEYFSGSMMIFNESRGRLVVKGSRECHQRLKRGLRGLVVCHLETKMRLLEVPGVSMARRSGMVSELPEHAKEVVEISCRTPEEEGIVFESKEDGFTLETRGEFDREEAFIYYDLNLKGRLRGAPFLLKSSGAVMPGLPEMIEIGSVTGEKTLVAVLSIDILQADGTPFDHWILSENGGAIFEGNRLCDARDLEALPDLTASGIHCYRFPPTLGMPSLPETLEGEILDPGKVEGIIPFRTELPQLGGGKWTDLYDLTQLMRQNGVSFGEGEFAVFRQKTRVLYLKVKGDDLALADAVIGHYQNLTPEIIRMDVLEVESSKRVDAEALKEGRFQIVNKMGLTVLPGRQGALALGGKLALEMEAHVDAGGGVLEARVVFDSRKGDLVNPIYRAGFVAGNELPVLLYQSQNEGKWRAFVAVSSVIDVYGEARE